MNHSVHIVDNDSLNAAARLAGGHCRYINAMTSPAHLVLDDGGSAHYGDTLTRNDDGSVTVTGAGQEALW